MSVWNAVRGAAELIGRPFVRLSKKQVNGSGRKRPAPVEYAYVMMKAPEDIEVRHWRHGVVRIQKGEMFPLVVTSTQFLDGIRRGKQIQEEVEAVFLGELQVCPDQDEAEPIDRD